MDKPNEQIAEQVCEEWKKIAGYEGIYEISNFGRVKSVLRTMPHKTFGTWIIRERILKLHKTGECGNKYLCAWLHSGGGVQRSHRVHRLVAEAFVPNVLCKEQVNHINGDKFNNRASNLEWATPLENTHHAWEHGLCESIGKSHARAVVNLDTMERFSSIKEAAESNGMTSRSVFQVVSGKTVRSAGYRWQYADEFDVGTAPRKTDNRNFTPVLQYPLGSTDLVNRYSSIQDAALSVGTSRQGITACCVGRAKSAGGYIWRYENEKRIS